MGMYKYKEYTNEELLRKILIDIKGLIDRFAFLPRVPSVETALNKISKKSAYLTEKNVNLGFDDLKHVAGQIEGIYLHWGFTLPENETTRKR